MSQPKNSGKPEYETRICLFDLVLDVKFLALKLKGRGGNLGDWNSGGLEGSGRRRHQKASRISGPGRPIDFLYGKVGAMAAETFDPVRRATNGPET